MRNKILSFVFVSIILIISNLTFAQKVSGFVKTENENNNKKSPVFGATVYWLNSTKATTTDVTGYFEIDKISATNKLIISLIAFENDTIEINNTTKDINIILTKSSDIEEVVVDGRQDGEYTSHGIQAKKIISEAGLTKLPCCNLSESFENNATVEVTYADAVTGARQIKMLGLNGKYSQILRENLASVRGLSSTYGLGFIPGVWMESVQISKGASTVINGYEATTGQINIELKKPEKSEKLFVNLYANSAGKLESNLTSAVKINDKVSTMIFLHASNLSFVHDNNGDGFADMPKMTQYNFMNRWKFDNNQKMDGQLGFRVLQDTKRGGQNGFVKGLKDQNYYGVTIDTRQYEVFGKLGFLVPGTDHTSFGSTYSLNRHEQKSMFGTKKYEGIQNSFYANFIFQTIIKTTANTLNFGGSFQYDDFDEKFNLKDYKRTEIVPGVFTQYTYVLPEKFSLIAGIRADFNNLYGTFISPRVHAKYTIAHGYALRASAGKGYRTANIFAENQSIFASSRVLVIQDDFKPEEALNYGLNFTGEFHMHDREEVKYSLDFYRTDFINQVITDVNTDVNEVRFYNLKGQSYANSFQAEVSLEPIKRFDVSAAFRFNDVHITMNNELIEKPFMNKFRGVIAMSYATKFKKWSVDVTNQFVGTSPLPDLSANPEQFRFEEKSPAYYILHVQLTKRWRHLDVYAGAENLTNYKQKNLIIDAENPFGNNFDASMVWGPVDGRRFFVGLRYKIK